MKSPDFHSLYFFLLIFVVFVSLLLPFIAFYHFTSFVSPRQPLDIRPFTRLLSFLHFSFCFRLCSLRYRILLNFLHAHLLGCSLMQCSIFFLCSAISIDDLVGDIFLFHDFNETYAPVGT